MDRSEKRNIKDRVRALEAENAALREQLASARRELVELRAVHTVDDDDVEELEGDLLEVTDEGPFEPGPAGFDDVKTDEHQIPFEQPPDDGSVAVLESMFEPEDAPAARAVDPFEEAANDATKSSPRLEPLETVEPLAEPPRVAPDRSDQIERKHTLAFVGAVVGMVILAAAVVGVVIYRTAEVPLASVAAAPAASGDPARDAAPQEPAERIADKLPEEAAPDTEPEPPEAAKVDKPAKPRKHAKKSKKKRAKKKKPPVVVVAPGD